VFQSWSDISEYPSHLKQNTEQFQDQISQGLKLGHGMRSLYANNEVSSLMADYN